MRNKLLILIITLSIYSCSQKPVPFEGYWHVKSNNEHKYHVVRIINSSIFLDENSFGGEFKIADFESQDTCFLPGIGFIRNGTQIQELISPHSWEKVNLTTSTFIEDLSSMLMVKYIPETGIMDSSNNTIFEYESRYFIGQLKSEYKEKINKSDIFIVDNYCIEHNDNILSKDDLHKWLREDHYLSTESIVLYIDKDCPVEILNEFFKIRDSNEFSFNIYKMMMDLDSLKLYGKKMK